MARTRKTFKGLDERTLHHCYLAYCVLGLLLAEAQLPIHASSLHRSQRSSSISIGQQERACPLGDMAAFVKFQVSSGIRRASVMTALHRLESDGGRKDLDQLRQELLMKLIDNQLLTVNQQISDLRPDNLPVRELPPGTTADLFLMYLAYMRMKSNSAADPASRATFYGVAKQWASCLRFRRRSQHAMCATCQLLKTAIRNTKVCASLCLAPVSARM